MITAFFFQGFLAVVIGAYMYYVSGRWARLKSFPGLAFRHIIRTRSLRGIPALVGDTHPTNPLQESMIADMIVLTSDMQTLSGVALMVAALSQLWGLSAYHAMLVSNIAWIPSQSHHLAFIYVFEPRPHVRHQGVRYAAITVYAVLYITFCACTYASVRKRWDLHTDCFRACTAPYCVGGFAERDVLLSWIVVNISLFVFSYIPVLFNCLRGHGRFGPGSKYGWFHFLGDALFNVWGFQVVMCFWTAFTLSGVYGYRKANQVLLKDGDAEEKWGFGQVIAVVSLLLVGFEFWKAFVSK